MMNKKFAATLAAAATAMALMAGCSSTASNGPSFDTDTNGGVVYDGGQPTQGTHDAGAKPSGTPKELTRVVPLEQLRENNVPSWAQPTGEWQNGEWDYLHSTAGATCASDMTSYDIDGNGTQTGNITFPMYPGGHYEYTPEGVSIWFDGDVPAGVIMFGNGIDFFQFDQGTKYYYIPKANMNYPSMTQQYLGTVCGK